MATQAKRLTEEAHKEQISQWLSENHSYRQIADALGVNKDTVKNFVTKFLPDQARTANGHYVQATVLKPLEEKPDELELLKTRLAQATSAAKKHRSVDVQAELVLEELRATVQPAPVEFEAPEQAEGYGHNHMHVLLLSDLHVGEVVDLEAMNGINEYNWEITQRRMQQVLDAMRSFANARPYPIDELVVAMLGDQNSGKNHGEIERTNEFTPTEQAYHTGMLLGKFVESLVEDYPFIRVGGVVGNHPRTQEKPMNKQVFDNWDWASYKYAELYLQNYETVSCEFPRSGQWLTEIAGKNALFFHGDGIRSTMPGVPWGGVIRRVNELRKQYMERGLAVKYFGLGHFHDANVVQGGSIWMNGSLKGPDEYTLKNFGGGTDPTQLLLTFDKDKERLTDVSYITPR